MNGEPDLWIGGEWRHASDGGTREIINPADGSVAAVVDEATPEDARRCRRRCARGVRRRRLARHPGGRACRAARPGRRSAAAGQGVAGRAGNQGHRQDPGREPNRHRRRHIGFPVLLAARRRRGGSARRRRRSRRDQPGGARTHRGMRADRAVELSAAADVMEGRACARRGLHDGGQTQRSHSADDDRVRPPARRGRRAAFGGEPGPGQRRDARGPR